MLKNIINLLNIGLELLKNIFDSISRRSRAKDIEGQQEQNKQRDIQIDNNIKNKDIDGLNEMLGYKKPSSKKTAKKAPTKKTGSAAPEPKKRGRKKKSEQ